MSVKIEFWPSSYSLWHVKRRNSTLGLKLELLIKLCCEVMVSLRQLQEYTAHREDHLGDVIFKK